MLIVYFASLSIAVLIGFALGLRVRSWRQSGRFEVAMLPFVAVLVATSMAQAIADAPYRSVWNPIRLTPALSLAGGFSLYHLPDSGPVTGHIYGPVGAMAYLPATWAPTSQSVLYLGTIISLSMYFAPPFWLARRMGVRTFDAPAYWAGIVAFSMFPILTFLRPQSLGYVATLVHADGPAIAAGAVAAGLLYLNPTLHQSTLLMSAALVVLAVGSKQVMAPLLIALPLWLGWVNGFRAAVLYAAYIAIVGAVAVAIAYAAFGPRELWFNLVTIPAHHPQDAARWGVFPTNVIPVFREWMEFAWPIIALLISAWILRRASLINNPVQTHRWTVFLVGACFLLPTSLLGRLKVGGDYNALSFSLYFLLLSACVLLRESTAHGRRWLAIIVVSIASAFLVRVQLEKFETLAVPQARVDAVVHDYIVNHPGEAYFPWNPMAHLQAEGKLYHFDYGVFDRDLAGFPLSLEHVLRHSPENPRLICFAPKANMQFVMRYFPKYSARVEVPELPGFDCFGKSETAP